MQITVTHLEGSKAGRTEQLDAVLVSVGRDPSNVLAFDPVQDIDVSARHAQLVVQGDQVMIQDLGSRNGTFLNGMKVGAAPVPVPNNALIAFGEKGPKVTVTFGPSGPGKKTQMVGNLQADLLAAQATATAAKDMFSKEKTKRSRGRAVACCLLFAVIAAAGTGGYFVWRSGEHKAEEKRVAARIEAKKGEVQTARASGKSAFAKAEWAKVDAAEKAAKDADGSGDQAKAAKAWEDAAALAQGASTKSLEEKAATEKGAEIAKLEEKHAAELKAFEEKAEKARKDREAELAKKDEDAKAEIDRLKKDAAAAAEAQRQALEAAKNDAKKTLELASRAKESKSPDEVKNAVTALEEQSKKTPGDAALAAELDALRKRFELLTSPVLKLEAAAKVARTAVVMIRSQTYAIPAGQTEETTQIRFPVSEGNGTGFFITKDRILTAKEVVEPWKFDPKTLGIATRLQERNALITRIEISELDEKGVFRVTHAAERKEAQIVVRGTEALDVEQKVKVPVEGGEVEVAVRPHKRDDSAYAVIEVKGANGTPLALAEKDARKPGDRVRMLGQQRVAPSTDVGLYSLDGDLKETGDRPIVGQGSYSSWLGGPVLDVDGKAAGVIIETGNKESRTISSARVRTN